jgi:hypothetical protein
MAQHDISCYREVEMSESESRVTRVLGPLSSGLAKLWSMARSAFTDFRDSGAGKRAASAVRDLQESDASKRAQSALHDLRQSDAGKRAATALHDLQESDAGKRVAGALQDLRQRDAVRKAEETARRTVHDLRGGRGGGNTSGTAVG